MRLSPIRAALAAVAAAAGLLWASASFAAESPQALTMARAQAQLAWRLIWELPSGEPSRVLSPASLSSALSALALGADPAMKAAIRQALNLASDSDDALAAVREGLRGADLSVLQSADRVVFPPRQPPTGEAAAKLKSAGVVYGVLDLSSWPGVRELDGWIAQKTDGAIRNFFGKPLDRPVFAIVNALHFKARWKEPFDPSGTFSGSFSDADGAVEKISLMKLGKGMRAYRREQNFVGVELPFVGDRFALVVVTSTDRPRLLANFDSVASWLSADGFTPQAGDLTLPRFGLEGGGDLTRALQDALAPGLSSPTALEGFAPGVTIGAVLQRVKIDVDEQGAQAAAATAIVAVTAALPAADEAIHMRVDKPFLFALRDRTSGLILAAGYVAKAPK